MQLLVPFLVEARIELMSISSMGRDSKGFEQIRVRHPNGQLQLTIVTFTVVEMLSHSSGGC